MPGAYRDGLLVAGEDAAESLQVSLLLPESQLQPPHLTLALLHTAELVVDGSLQAAQINRYAEFCVPFPCRQIKLNASAKGFLTFYTALLSIAKCTLLCFLMSLHYRKDCYK